MFTPGLYLFVSSILVLISCVYYRYFRKDVIRSWPEHFKFLIYSTWVIALMVFIWGLVSILVTGGVR